MMVRFQKQSPSNVSLIIVFYVLNVRSMFEGRNKRNPNLNPFTDPNDERLSWLTENFIGNIDEWTAEGNAREY